MLAVVFLVYTLVGWLVDFTATNKATCRLAPYDTAIEKSIRFFRASWIFRLR